MEGNQMKYSSEARVFSEWNKKKCHIGQIRKMNWQHKFAEAGLLGTEKMESSPKSKYLT